jgi:hypothetical protein
MSAGTLDRCGAAQVEVEQGVRMRGGNWVGRINDEAMGG